MPPIGWCVRWRRPRVAGNLRCNEFRMRTGFNPSGSRPSSCPTRFHGLDSGCHDVPPLAVRSDALQQKKPFIADPMKGFITLPRAPSSAPPGRPRRPDGFGLFRARLTHSRITRDRVMLNQTIASPLCRAHIRACYSCRGVLSRSTRIPRTAIDFATARFFPSLRVPHPAVADPQVAET